MSTATGSSVSCSTRARTPVRLYSTCTPMSWVAPCRKAPLATETAPTGGASGDSLRTVIHVDTVSMVDLLGPQDRLLRTIEEQHPLVSVFVRGNEISLEGPASQVRAANTLVEE